MATSVQWTDLPNDLLHVLFVRVGGHLHRVRFAAVCRPWRAVAIAARHAGLPALPWLIFHNGRDDKGNTRKVYCPEDDGFLRFRLPKALIGKSFMGSYDGGWVAALGDDRQLAIVNLFSGVEVPLNANKDKRKFYAYQKVVFSESPTSSRCILATITTQNSVALCRIGCPAKRWTAKVFNGPGLVDIAFYNEKLYALTDLEDLIKFKIGVNKDGRPVVTVELHMQIGSRPFRWGTNIVELHGKLAMVVKQCFVDNTYRKRFFFRVSVLVDRSTEENTPKWEEVTTLGDCALFFGRMWTKALCVPAAGCGRVQRSAIYADDVTYFTSLDGHGDCVYPMRDESSDDATHGIKSVGPYTCGYVPCGMWVLPPDF